MNEQLIDVDFRFAPDMTGAIDQPPDEFDDMLCAAVKVETFRDVFGADIIPEADFADWIDRTHATRRNCVRRIFNQGSYPSCVGNACCGSLSNRMFFQYGQDRWVDLSAASTFGLYGGAGGAYIPTGIEYANKKGFIPLDTPVNRERYGDIVYPEQNYRARRPSGWEPVAQQFEIEQWYRIDGDDIESLFTAVQAMNRPAVYGRSGHAIYLNDFEFDGRGNLYGCYCNSWGRWGDPVDDRIGYGIGYDSRRTLSGCWFYAVGDVTHRA